MHEPSIRKNATTNKWEVWYGNAVRSSKYEWYARRLYKKAVAKHARYLMGSR